MSSLRIRRADLGQPEDRRTVLELTRDYARDPMGDGQDLPAGVQSVLLERLQAHPTTRIFLAYDGPEAVGIATCFVGFSTFNARPLLNVHDLHVVKSHRRHGVATRLLQAVEEEARVLGCCKVTLEVQEKNHTAQALYGHLGFVSAGLFRERRL